MLLWSAVLLPVPPGPRPVRGCVALMEGGGAAPLVVTGEFGGGGAGVAPDCAPRDP